MNELFAVNFAYGFPNQKYANLRDFFASIFGIWGRSELKLSKQQLKKFFLKVDNLIDILDTLESCHFLIPRIINKTIPYIK